MCTLWSIDVKSFAYQQFGCAPLFSLATNTSANIGLKGDPIATLSVCRCGLLLNENWTLTVHLNGDSVSSTVDVTLSVCSRIELSLTLTRNLFDGPTVETGLLSFRSTFDLKWMMTGPSKLTTLFVFV